MVSRRRRLLGVFFIAVIILQVFAVTTFAVDDITQLNQELDKQPDLNTRSSNLWLDFLKLIVVLGLIIGAAWSVIRLLGKQASSRMQGTWLHVVDEVMLGQNRGIVLCEIGEKIYAIGVTDHNISMLFEVNNPKILEEISQIDLGINQNTARLNEIKSKLAGVWGRKTDSGQRNFGLLMAEQSKRLEQISYKSMEHSTIAEKRSGENDQV